MGQRALLMAIPRNSKRYQVLYKAHAPKTGVEVVNCPTLPVARRTMKRLKAAGETEVQIWDTRHNPISDMFAL